MIVLYMLLGLAGAAFLLYLLARGMADGESSDDWLKSTYTASIEKVNEQTANVAVNGRTFTVAQNRSGIHVQETTGGRLSSWVTISESSARFGKSKPQAAADYIKRIVDDNHRIPKR